jgi:hypothetical protein
MLPSELLIELSPKREADLKIELTPQAQQGFVSTQPSGIHQVEKTIDGYSRAWLHRS